MENASRTWKGKWTVVGPACVLVACGSTDSGNVEGFLGTWQYTTAAQSLTCPALDPMVSTREPTWEIVITRSGRAGLRYEDGEGCVYRFAVDGRVASLAGQQSCETLFTFPDGAAGTLTVTLQEATLTLDEAGILTEHGSGIALAVAVASSASVSCSVDATGELEKSSL